MTGQVRGDNAWYFAPDGHKVQFATNGIVLLNLISTLEEQHYRYQGKSDSITKKQLELPDADYER